MVTFNEKYSTVKLPDYPCGGLVAVYPCNDGVYEYLIDNTTEKAHEDYITALCSLGFELYGKNSFNGNRFATLNNERASIFLTYTAHDGFSRVIISAREHMLPSMAEARESVCESKLCMVAIGQKYRGVDFDSCPYGVSFVIRLKDGRFIIIDGGVNNADEVDKLYGLLDNLSKSYRGKEIPTVAAWILTHPDGDHWGCMYGMSQKYAHKIKLERIIYNIYDASVECGMRPAACGAGDRVHNIYVPAIAEGFDCDTLVKVHTGQKFFIGDIRFEVLFTHEDLYPVLIDHTNDASVVLKMTAGDKVFLLTADAEGRAARQINAQCGSYLKCDYAPIFPVVKYSLNTFISLIVLLLPIGVLKLHPTHNGAGLLFFFLSARCIVPCGAVLDIGILVYDIG